jgi:RNA polymerase sigma-70 factor (ECF subfamily)
MDLQQSNLALADKPDSPSVHMLEKPALNLATAQNLQMLKAYVGALSHDPGAVDDLAQEVLLRAIERLDRLRNPDDPGPFLRGIARHVVQEHFKSLARNKGQVYDAALAMVMDGDSPDIACHQRVMIKALHDAIAALPIVSRRLIEMRYGQSLRAREIGQKMNIQPTAVRVSLLRIRDRLKRDIENRLRMTDRF